MEKAEKKLHGGFTLVELLVVVGVISLLIAMLLPAISKAREAANRTVCASNIRQLAMATISYASQYRGQWPDLHNTLWSWNILDPSYPIAVSSFWPNGTSNVMDNMIYRPNVFAVNARDMLVGASGPISVTGLLSAANRTKFGICYCPSKAENNSPANWQLQGVQTFPPGVLTPQWCVSSAFDYNYYCGSYFWYGRWSLNDNDLPIVPNESPTIPMHSSAFTGQPTFSMRMGDRPQYAIMWSDRTVAYPTVTNGIGDYFAAANHVRGKESASPRRIALGATGGANAGYSDGHVEWKTATSISAPNKILLYHEDETTPQMHEFVPTD